MSERFIQVLTDSCQVHMISHINIIKADNRQIVRDFDI
jgi:hypothetical protein